MTNKEAFDRVKKHLLTQMKASRSEITGACMYRGPNGLKCAIGCLIPDEEYSPKLENKSPDNIQKDVPTFQRLNITLLCHLQQIHDYYPPESWARELDQCMLSHPHLLT